MGSSVLGGHERLESIRDRLIGIAGRRRGSP
jgi:hypothetical protein